MFYYQLAMFDDVAAVVSLIINLMYMLILTSKCHWYWVSIIVVGRFLDEVNDDVWSSVVEDPPVTLVNVVKLEWCGVVDVDDVAELIDFVDDDGSLTRERKLRNVDNGEGECVSIAGEDDADEHNEWDEWDGKHSRWWGW